MCQYSSTISPYVRNISFKLNYDLNPYKKFYFEVVFNIIMNLLVMYLFKNIWINVINHEETPNRITNYTTSSNYFMYLTLQK